MSLTTLIKAVQDIMRKTAKTPTRWRSTTATRKS